MFDYDQYCSQQLGVTRGMFGQFSNANFLESLLGSCARIGANQACGPDSEGWHTYDPYNRPPKYKLCVFERRGTEQRGTGYASEFHPEFNIANLKWQLTGIEKESL